MVQVPTLPAPYRWITHQGQAQKIRSCFVGTGGITHMLLSQASIVCQKLSSERCRVVWNAIICGPRSGKARNWIVVVIRHSKRGASTALAHKHQSANTRPKVILFLHTGAQRKATGTARAPLGTCKAEYVFVSQPRV